MTETMRALVYGRQSRGKAKSIAEQVKAGLAAITAEGWTHAGTYQDGSSASRHARTARDDWPRVLAEIEAGRVDVVILWESSRGDRTPETWFAFLSSCRRHGVRLHVIQHERTYNLGNARDWKVLADDGVNSAYESELLSVRVRRGHAGAAAEGRPSHGRTPYGYRRTYDPATGKLIGQEPDPATAPIVREIIGKAARGVPIVTIVADLTERGVPAVNGGRWYRTRVRDIALNPAYAGLRVYNGQTYPGDWPPLVDPEVARTAVQVLTDPARVTTRPGGQRHLLSYLATCQPCGAGLTAVRGRYRCGESGCVTILQAPMDALVEQQVWAYLERPGAYEALRRHDAESSRAAQDAQAEVDELTERLNGWRRSAARNETSPASLAVIEADLSAQIRAAQRRADKASVPPALRQVLEPGVDVRTRWEEATVPVRREVVRYLAVVKVGPAALPGSREFEPDRLGGSWWVDDDLTWAQRWAMPPEPAPSTT